MGLVRKTISVTDEQDAWVKAEVESGAYTNDSEVHRDAIKQVKQWKEKRAWLEKEIRKGMESPVINQTIPEIIAELKDELKASGDL